MKHRYKAGESGISFESKVTRLPSMSGSPADAMLLLGEFDSSAFDAVDVENNIDLLFDCREFGGFLKKHVKDAIVRSRLFGKVAEQSTNRAKTWLRLSAELESLTLVNNWGLSFTAKARVRVRLEHMPQGYEVTGFSLEEKSTDPGRLDVAAALDTLAFMLAESLVGRVASPTIRDYVASHPELGGLAGAETAVAAPVPIRPGPDFEPRRQERASAIDRTAVDFGSYHVLAIGIDQYAQLPGLRSAAHDARTVAALLQEKYGFQVQLLVDPNRMDILKALGEFRSKLTRNDNLLVYYAGHGWLDEDADQGYWLPADATGESKANWVSNSDVTSELRAMQAKHIMVIADSCYSGKLVRGLHIKQKSPDYIARMARKTARVVLSSGGLEPVVDSSGFGDHSVFASVLLQVLRENKSVLDGTTLFTLIRRPVMLNADQTPQFSDIRKAGHDGGDFLFVPK